MAYNDNSKATQFKPGESGNPAGSSLVAGEKRAFRKVSAACLDRIAEAIFYEGPDALEAMAKDPKFTMIERLCASVVAKAINKGDAQALNTILDRFVGKVKDVSEIKHFTPGSEDYRRLTPDELARRRELLARAEDPPKEIDVTESNQGEQSDNET